MPASPGSTLPYACAYQVLALPVTQMGWIYYPDPGATPTPTPVSYLPQRGVIRSTVEWQAFLTAGGLDPTLHPPPVDLDRKMILFRTRQTNECPTVTSIQSVDCHPDRIDVTVLNLTDYNLYYSGCFPIYYPYPRIAYFGTWYEGYVMDRTNRPVLWYDQYMTTGTPVILFPYFPPNCPTCVQPHSGGGSSFKQ
jgi:hypothetical protein